MYDSENFQVINRNQDPTYRSTAWRETIHYNVPPVKKTEKAKTTLPDQSDNALPSRLLQLFHGSVLYFHLSTICSFVEN